MQPSKHAQNEDALLSIKIELKRHHELTRAKYRGLFRTRVQALLTVFVVNVKRMVKLMGQKCSQTTRKLTTFLYFKIDLLGCA